MMDFKFFRSSAKGIWDFIAAWLERVSGQG